MNGSRQLAHRAGRPPFTKRDLMGCVVAIDPRFDKECDGGGDEHDTSERREIEFARSQFAKPKSSVKLPHVLPPLRSTAHGGSCEQRTSEVPTALLFPETGRP